MLNTGESETDSCREVKDDTADTFMVKPPYLYAELFATIKPNDGYDSGAAQSSTEDVSTVRTSDQLRVWCMAREMDINFFLSRILKSHFYHVLTYVSMSNISLRAVSEAITAC